MIISKFTPIVENKKIVQTNRKINRCVTDFLNLVILVSVLVFSSKIEKEIHFNISANNVSIFVSLKIFKKTWRHRKETYMPESSFFNRISFSFLTFSISSDSLKKRNGLNLFSKQLDGNCVRQSTQVFEDQQLWMHKQNKNDISFHT